LQCRDHRYVRWRDGQTVHACRRSASCAKAGGCELIGPPGHEHLCHGRQLIAPRILWGRRALAVFSPFELSGRGARPGRVAGQTLSESGAWPFFRRASRWPAKTAIGRGQGHGTRARPGGGPTGPPQLVRRLRRPSSTGGRPRSRRAAEDAEPFSRDRASRNTLIKIPPGV